MKLSSSFNNFLYVVSVIVATAIPVLTVNAQTAESDSLYSEGMTLFEQGKYKDAIVRSGNSTRSMCRNICLLMSQARIGWHIHISKWGMKKWLST